MTVLNELSITEYIQYKTINFSSIKYPDKPKYPIKFPDLKAESTLGFRDIIRKVNPTIHFSS